MKIKRYIYLTALLLLAAACSRDEWPDAEPQCPERPAPETVSLSFRLSGRIAGTRAAGDEASIRSEEGEVRRLCYAVFRHGLYEIGKDEDLTTENLQTGDRYLASNLDRGLFDASTEIFAVANASEVLRNRLFVENPPVVSPDNPLLQQAVDDYIDMQARIAVYNDVIKNHLRNGTYPNDGDGPGPRLFFLPANTGNYVVGQYNLERDGISFSDYISLIENRDKETDAGKRAIYDIIAEDLACRLELFQKNNFNNKKAAYKSEESLNGTYSGLLSQDPAFGRYVLWHDLTCEENLNATTAAADTRLVDSPLMAGYLALTEEPGSIITVPVEHVYCRIWFRFAFVGVATAPDVEVEKIEVEGVPQKTRIFNVSDDPEKINIADSKETVGISREDGTQTPFFGDLTRTEAPWHVDKDGDGSIHVLCFDPDYPSYNVVCRYPLANGTFDVEHLPVRYYLYGYQWSGNTYNDDPVVKVVYRFLEEGQTVRKTASARLFDENHAAGKPHHGLLRNYTYGVNGQLNAASHDLTLQVTSHDWYKIPVDDIPSFD